MSIKSTFCMHLLLLFSIEKVHCKCEKSYVNFCDDFSDIEPLDPDDVGKWTDLVVGNKNNNDPSQQYTITTKTIPFGKFNKLTSLTLVNKVKEIESDALVSDHDFTKLEVLSFYGGSIKRLKSTSFDSYTLRKLKFTNTDLDYIEEGVFYNCHIKTMDFSGNELEAVGRGVFTDFHGCNETAELILRHNRISALHQDAFPDGLEILNLDHNQIQVLNPPVFKRLINLIELTASYNRIISLPDFSHLTKLITLGLSHNAILFLYMSQMNAMAELQVLDMSYNRLSDPYFFEDFNSTTDRYDYLQISLVFNRFTHLFVDSDALDLLDILYYGNPWHCKCWTQIERIIAKRKHKRNVCDVKYFSNGQMPFCYEYPGNWTCHEKIYRNPSQLQQSDYDVFLNSIINNKKLFHCDLTIRAWDNHRLIHYT